MRAAHVERLEIFPILLPGREMRLAQPPVRRMTILVSAVANAIARSAHWRTERSARPDVIRPMLAAHIGAACA